MTGARFAIILAGGRGSRLGDVDKPGLDVGGRRLLDAAIGAVGDAHRIVVVGPDRALPPTIGQTREDPPGSGPVAALTAGFAALDADAHAGEIVVLAADLPFLTAGAIDTLSRARAEAGAPAAFALDSTGRLQYLVGVWDVAAVREALAAATGSAMRGLIPAAAIGVAIDDDVIADVDTPDELDAARRRAPRPAVRVSPPVARTTVAAACRPLPAVTFAAGDAAGTVLATGLRAAAPFPSFDVSAMDGYAVAGRPPWNVLAHSVSAGSTGHPALSPGQAVRIATGAMLPAGADRVIRDEEVTLDAATAGPPQLTSTAADRDDTRRRGSEWAAGDELFAEGTPVDDALMSVARSAGVTELEVRGPLRAVVHPTGDEITADAAAAGTILDTASAPVCGLLRRNGFHARVGGHLADDPEAFRAALRDPDADVVVAIGATGHGVADHLRAALRSVGAQIVLDGVDMRPGGSLLVATIPAGPVILGVGGNPLAALAGAALLIGPISATLTHAAPRPAEYIVVDAVEELSRPTGWRMTPVTPAGDGRWSAPQRVPTAHLRALVGTSGFALIPPGAHACDLVELVR